MQINRQLTNRIQDDRVLFHKKNKPAGDGQVLKILIYFMNKILLSIVQYVQIVQMMIEWG